MHFSLHSRVEKKSTHPRIEQTTSDVSEGRNTESTTHPRAEEPKFDASEGRKTESSTQLGVEHTKVRRIRACEKTKRSAHPRVLNIIFKNKK